MLHHAGLPDAMWPAAVDTAVYLLNRTTSTASGEPNKTPEEIWSGVKPSCEHLRIFGCDVFVLLQQKTSGVCVRASWDRRRSAASSLATTRGDWERTAASWMDASWCHVMSPSMRTASARLRHCGGDCRARPSRRRSGAKKNKNENMRRQWRRPEEATRRAARAAGHRMHEQRGYAWDDDEELQYMLQQSRAEEEERQQRRGPASKKKERKSSVQAEEESKQEEE